MDKAQIGYFNYNSIMKNGISLLPTKCIFYLTLRCNLSCDMCFQKKHKPIREMSLEDIKRVFQKLSVSYLHLVGGEIFVRKDIKEILLFLNSTIENISIQTNATFLDKEMCDFLIGMTNVKEICISIDGLEDLHDSIRGKGVYQQAIYAIRKLRVYKNISVNTVVMKRNISQIEQLYNLLNTEGVDLMCLQLEMIYSNEQFQSSQRTLIERDILSQICGDCVEEQIDLSYIKSFKNTIEFLGVNQKHTKIVVKPSMYARDISSYVQGHIKAPIYCEDIKNSVIKIYPNGDVMLCEALGIVLGNCLEQNIRDIWNSHDSTYKRKRLCNPSLVDMCCRCCNANKC